MDTKNVTTGTETRNQILEAQATTIDAILDLPAPQRSRAILEHTRQLKAASRVRVKAQLLAERSPAEEAPEVAAARERLRAFGFVWTPATAPPPPPKSSRPSSGCGRWALSCKTSHRGRGHTSGPFHSTFTGGPFPHVQSESISSPAQW